MAHKLLAPLVALIVALGLSISASASAQPARYAYTDLGVLGGLDSYAWTLNDRGQVTGHADASPNSGTRGFHAFLWTPFKANGTTGSMIDLGTLPGGGSSIGNGINGSGIVVGESLSADLSTSSAYIYKGSMFDLGSFGGTYSSANGINARGQVVGYSKTRRSLDHAFLWVPKKPGATKGHMYDLGTLPGAAGSVANAINSGGTVTGYNLDADFFFAHAFVWRPAIANGTSGKMTSLVELPGATGSSGQAINARGLIAGSVELTTGSHAFVYDTAMHDLGTLAGGNNSYAYSINSSGEIVGWSETVDFNAHAFLYANGRMTDLNKLLPGSVRSSGVVLTAAYGINDKGQIVGHATVSGHAHAYLLTPAS
jgi:probable HAF family extracellular repeat protein